MPPQRATPLAICVVQSVLGNCPPALSEVIDPLNMRLTATGWSLLWLPDGRVGLQRLQ